MGDRDDAIVDIDPPGRSAPDDDGGTYISEFDQRNNVFLAGEPTWRDTLTDKGNISNMISLALFIVGIVVVAIWPDITPLQFVLSFGLYGFCAGFTNSIAIWMLFDKIPGLYGSGIIVEQFKEIREKIADTIMGTFFNEQFLAKYLAEKAGQMAEAFDVEDKLSKLLNSSALDRLFDEKLDEFYKKPEGLWLSMSGISRDQVAPMIRPFLLGISSDVAPVLLENLNPLEYVNVSKIRFEINNFLAAKLEELDAQTVKRILSSVMREHLCWLVIWGNVFGAIIGVVTKALNLVFDYTGSTGLRF